MLHHDMTLVREEYHMLPQHGNMCRLQLSSVYSWGFIGFILL